MASETCGWLIKGDPSRPCVWKPGHKSKNHCDEEYAEHRREYDRGQWASSLEYRERKRARKQQPEAQARAREYSREWYRQNTEHAREYALKYREVNNEKYLLTMRVWREANPAYGREHYKVNPEIYAAARQRRRAYERKVPHRNWTREQVIELYGNACYLCGGPYEHTDHVIPISRGGWDMLPNLRPACAACNLSKSDKMPSVIIQAKIWYELGVHRAGLVCE